MEIKNQSNFSVHGWMPKLGLKGTQLLIYALIYSYTKNGQEFTGSLTYLCEWLNCTRSTVINALKELRKKEFINKTKVKINNMTFCRYTTNMTNVNGLNSPLPVQNPALDRLKIVQPNSIKSAPNNTNINKSISNEDFINYWNELRQEHFGKPSFLNSLTREDKEILFELSQDYEPVQFREALIGLFKQKQMPNGNTVMQSNPKHFLNFFNTYLTAYHDQNSSLYGKEKQIEGI